MVVDWPSSLVGLFHAQQTASSAGVSYSFLDCVMQYSGVRHTFFYMTALFIAAIPAASAVAGLFWLARSTWIWWFNEDPWLKDYMIWQRGLRSFIVTCIILIFFMYSNATVHVCRSLIVSGAKVYLIMVWFCTCTVHEAVWVFAGGSRLADLWIDSRDSAEFVAQRSAILLDSGSHSVLLQCAVRCVDCPVRYGTHSTSY